MRIYEACVGSFQEALEAEKKGAQRIELCDNLLDDGTTPSYGTIKAAVDHLHIPSMVMIRPRGGNFVYSEIEKEIMKHDIEMCNQHGVLGVVFGVLTPDNQIDIEFAKDLTQAAKPMEVIFHMAFDEVEDQCKAMDQLIEIGVDRILTKGGAQNAMAGKDALKKLVEYAAGRITIMPGKGVNLENRDMILEHTGATEIHGTKVV